MNKTKTDLFHFGKLTSGVFIIAQIFFIAHQDDGNIRTKVFHFRCPLFRNILYSELRERMQLLATYLTLTITRCSIDGGVTVAETIPKLSGLSTEKHMRITSVSG